ncbi:MAG TPA: AAA family ATPase, partial [Flavobacterium sp.]
MENTENNFNTTPEIPNENVNFQSRIDLNKLQESIVDIKAELSSVIVGQHKMIDQLLVAILSNGHILLEGVPGVAKTITAKLLAKTLNIDFSRIQFTPDLMPSDILGTSVYDLKKSEFEFKKGPVFSNLILIDEINRAPAKTQAALFEVMEERQITIDGTTYILDTPFLVIATQNPIEQEGTYRLPEAQLDRFLFKISIDYPKLDEEIVIIQREHLLQNQGKLENIKTLLSSDEIKHYQTLVKQIIVEPQLLEYIAKIVVNTRGNAFL